MLQAENAPTGLARYVPIVGWLPRYQPAWLRFDLVAGLTAAAVVIPQAMAYAAIAGLPVQVGLYTALVPMQIYILLGWIILPIVTAVYVLIAPAGNPRPGLAVALLGTVGRHRCLGRGWLF